MTRKITLPEPWLSLALHLGGVGKMALALRSARGTINQWANGARVPSRLTQSVIVAVFKKHGIEPPVF